MKSFGYFIFSCPFIAAISYCAVTVGIIPTILAFMTVISVFLCFTIGIDLIHGTDVFLRHMRPKQEKHVFDWEKEQLKRDDQEYEARMEAITSNKDYE